MIESLTGNRGISSIVITLADPLYYYSVFTSLPVTRDNFQISMCSLVLFYSLIGLNSQVT